MPISKADYEDKKEYWDYQRLLEFNRELLKQRLEKMQGSVFTQLASSSKIDLDLSLYGLSVAIPAIKEFINFRDGTDIDEVND